MLVSGNNLSACVGPAVGSRILSKRTGALLGAGGFAAGLLIQGGGMINSINNLMPNATMQFQAEVLIVAIVIFIIAQVARLPLSFSMSLVGLLGGFTLARGLTSQIPLHDRGSSHVVYRSGNSRCFWHTTLSATLTPAK